MNLFLYGTLQHAPLYAAVAGVDPSFSPAILHDYAVTGVEGDVVPMLQAAQGVAAVGQVVRDVTDQAQLRLDLFESAWGYTLIDVTVETADGPLVASVYLPPEHLVPDGQGWSLDRWQDSSSTLVTMVAQDLFGRDPLPSPKDLRFLWQMAGRRAAARIRAASRRDQPSTLRFNPAPQDFEILSRSPAQGGFFALQHVRIRHRRFDGMTSDILDREVFLGIDAALVLPYDPVSDRVLLVEQFRMAPLMLDDPNPWVLEPIAGMVDTGETPKDAALREAREEAGLDGLDLRHIASFYPSPGSSTDYFHAYLGLCDLPDGDRYSGGLASEHEDLRLHPVPFDQAMALVESGEITAGPLMLMLHWLAARRGSFA